MKRISLIFILSAFFIAMPSLFSKRVAPRPVEPVYTSTLRIEAPLDNGREARIKVFDRADGRLLWSIVVFENKINPALEEDVQWRFITQMKVTGDTLEIAAEAGGRFRVDLKERKVEVIEAPRKRG